MKDPEEFQLSDLLALPEPQVVETTRVFEARGRKWPITATNVGMVSAEAFFDIASQMKEFKSKGSLRFMLPGGIPLEITAKDYLAGLSVLTRVVVKPRFSLEEWAIFGHKLGGDVMNDLMEWVADLNGFQEELQQKELDDAKNASSAEVSTT